MKKNLFIRYLGPLIAASILRFSMLPTKAFAVETNLPDQTELCLEDSRHALKTGDLQTTKTLEEKGKNTEILAKEHKAFKEEDNAFKDDLSCLDVNYVAINLFPLRDIRNDINDFINTGDLTLDEIKKGYKTTAKCAKFLVDINKANNTNQRAFENLNKNLLSAKLVLTQKDSNIDRLKSELTESKKENVVLNQTKEKFETNIKLKNQIGDPLLDQTSAPSNLKPDTMAVIKNVKIRDLDLVQSVYLNYPTKDDEVYLVNGVLIRPERPASHTTLKGQIFKIKHKLRIKTDLEIVPESQDNQASYSTMVIVEADPNL